MSKYTKLIFYYEPDEVQKKNIRSFTLSFSRIDAECDTYKQKAILERVSEKDGKIEEYKMKEVHIGAKELLKKIDKIDFNKSYTKCEPGGEKLYISYGDKHIETGSPDEIMSILNEFSFFNLFSIPYQHYEFVKDMNEYVKLVDILYKKLLNLNDSNKMFLIKNFKLGDPYKYFQNIPYLESYINFLKNSKGEVVANTTKTINEAV